MDGAAMFCEFVPPQKIFDASHQFRNAYLWRKLRDSVKIFCLLGVVLVICMKMPCTSKCARDTKFIVVYCDQVSVSLLVCFCSFHSILRIPDQQACWKCLKTFHLTVATKHVLEYVNDTLITD